MKMGESLICEIRNLIFCRVGISAWGMCTDGSKLLGRCHQ